MLTLRINFVSFLLGAARLNYVLQFEEPRDMRKALESSAPVQLHDIYERAMISISQNSKRFQSIQKILSWIYYAKRPLQMDELREALAIRENDVQLDEDDFMSPHRIIEICGGLVTYEKETKVITFIHKEVHEFFMTRRSIYLLSELEMAKTCLHYLLLDAFKEPSPDEQSLKDRIQKHNFAQYAARNWGAHVKSTNAEGDQDIRKLLSKLGQSSNTLDAMSELSKVDNASDWFNVSRDRGMTLFHLLAENDLTILTQELANPANEMVLCLSPVLYINPS